MQAREEKDVREDEIFEFLSGIDSSTFFHTPAWTTSLSRAFGNIEPSYIVAREGADIKGLMPLCRIHKGGFHILSALPFGTYGTPVVSEHDASASILELFYSISSSWRCLEVRANLYGEPDMSAWRDDFVKGEGECRVADLGNGFSWYRSNQLSRKKRQICNGYEKEEVEVRPLIDENEVDRFYDIYLEGSSDWGGVHPYPKRLFHELFGRRASGVVFWGAFARQEMLGGHIDMYFGKMAQAWQAGMPRSSSSSSLASFLVFKAVEEACRLGVEQFNLGSSGGDEGMIFFKESMGGVKKAYPLIEKRKSWWKILKR